MRAGTSVFVLIAALLSTLPTSSRAIERDRSFEISSKDRSRAAAAAVDPRAINRLISEINAAAQKDKRRILSLMVINTNVAATTLEQQKARTGLSLGDIYVAHALSLATRKKFDTIVALKTGGQSWSQIARAHNVSLKGSTEMLKEMMRKS